MSRSPYQAHPAPTSRLKEWTTVALWLPLMPFFWVKAWMGLVIGTPMVVAGLVLTAYHSYAIGLPILIVGAMMSVAPIFVDEDF